MSACLDGSSSIGGRGSSPARGAPQIDAIHAAQAKTLAEDVRRRLDAAGHAAVAMEAMWIRFENLPDGCVRAVTEVPLGRGHVLPVSQLRRAPNEAQDVPDDSAERLAEALPKIAVASGALVRRARAVSRAVRITSDAGRGEMRSLASHPAEFAPIPAETLAGPNARNVLLHARCTVRVVGLGPDLKGEEHRIEVEQSSEVEDLLEPLLREQPERWRLKNRALAPGPLLEVDAVTVGLIEAAGLDPVDVLRRFSDDWQFSLPIAWNGEQRTIYLTSERTRIRSQQGLERGSHRVYWSGGGIGVEKSRSKTKLARPGVAASVLTDHPAFRDRTIMRVETDESGSCWVELDEPLLSFDASTGSFRTCGRQPDED